MSKAGEPNGVRRAASWFQIFASAIVIITSILTGIWFIIGIRTDALGGQIRADLKVYERANDSTHAMIVRKLLEQDERIAADAKITKKLRSYHPNVRDE